MAGRTSSPAPKEVDLDEGAARERGDADARAGRQPLRVEERTVDPVESIVVLLESREITARADDVLQPESYSRKHEAKILQDETSLSLDALRKGGLRLAGVGWHLPRDEDPAVDFRRVGEGPDGLWGTSDPMVLNPAHHRSAAS